MDTLCFCERISVCCQLCFHLGYDSRLCCFFSFKFGNKCFLLCYLCFIFLYLLFLFLNKCIEIIFILLGGLLCFLQHFLLALKHFLCCSYIIHYILVFVQFIAVILVKGLNIFRLIKHITK